MMSFEIKKAAVLMHRGGLKEATDGQIQTIWNSLDTATQEQYLQALQKKRADRIRTNKTKKDDKEK